MDSDFETILYPGQSVVLANEPETSNGMPKRRLVAIDPISGDLTYRDETTTSVPSTFSSSTNVRIALFIVGHAWLPR